MNIHDLSQIAQQLVAPGKGILAADESSPTIKKRFDGIGVASTEANRRDYRELLFGTEQLSEHISGVILYDETIRQHCSDDSSCSLADLLIHHGIIAGIKVDRGTTRLENFTDEKVTQGLDDLAERCRDYYELGARFTKWRAVLTVGNHLPSDFALRVNAIDLARFAAISQQAGLVPIVEPEVLMDGAHTLAQCELSTQRTLAEVFNALQQQRVQLEGILLKASMVISGKDCPEQATSEQVAEATLRVLDRTVPAAVPGVVFLSGGQTPQLATENLNAMNAMGESPWQLSFSYGRALQEPALKAWQGQMANGPATQAALLNRARLNGAARYGRYTRNMENAT